MPQDFYYNIYFIGVGMLTTLKLLFGGVVIGMILGVAMSFLRRTNIVVNFIINRLVSLIRGTPVILQLAFIYFAIPGVIGVKLSIITAGIITFGLNSSAYLAEILRAGVENIPKGQFEAAITLKIPTFYMWKDIILPQVIRNVLPAIISEIIALLKETALIATLGGMDIMRSAQTIAAEQFTYFAPLCIAGVYYYLLVLIIEYCGKVIETNIGNAKN